MCVAAGKTHKFFGKFCVNTKWMIPNSVQISNLKQFMRMDESLASLWVVRTFSLFFDVLNNPSKEMSNNTNKILVLKLESLFLDL